MVGESSTSCGANSCTVQVSRTTTTTTATTATTKTTSITPSTIHTTKTVTSTTTTTTTNLCCNRSTQRLGFWLQESDIMQYYSPSAFFDAMFMTPPYPSSMEVMIFGVLQDQTNSRTPGAAGSYTASSISYWGQVAQLAESYPKIRLVFEIAFNASSTTYGLPAFETIVNALGQYSSVYGLGVEGEYTSPETLSLMTTAMSYVSAVGKQFINYYPARNVLPPGATYIIHTNFPGGDVGGYDQVGTLRLTNTTVVGIDSGYYANFQFPSTVACPIGKSAINASTAGWNQCVVSTELSTTVSFSPASARQFLEVDVGFWSNGSFVGVSGQTTNQLWDNPTLRNWLWTDPSYQTSFVLAP
jgi:hypothetical protein